MGQGYWLDAQNVKCSLQRMTCVLQASARVTKSSTSLLHVPPGYLIDDP